MAAVPGLHPRRSFGVTTSSRCYIRPRLQLTLLLRHVRQHMQGAACLLMGAFCIIAVSFTPLALFGTCKFVKVSYGDCYVSRLDIWQVQ